MPELPEIKRILPPPNDSFFLLGPRGVGKTTWVHANFQGTKFIDLLDTKSFLQLARDPSLLEGMIGNQPQNSWVCIDEIQKAPMLLNEVQRLMASRKWRFVLTGSSARKLRRSGANMLGGRAITKQLEGFSFAEITGLVSLEFVLEFGTLPLIIQKRDIAAEILETYVSTYIKEEIREEGIIRKVDPFLRFLEVAGLLNGQKIVMQNIARDAGVPASNVQNYYAILVDTLVGHFLPAYRPRAKVREVAHSKFYWFDSGVARASAGLVNEHMGADTAGFALETLIFHELRVYNHTHKKYRHLFYYETGAGVEIDFIIETRKKTAITKPTVVTIEVKNSKKWKREWERPSVLLKETETVNVQKAIGIYTGTEKLEFESFTVYPFSVFVDELFKGGVF